MVSDPSPEADLIRALANDLEPVRPIPPLRVMVAIVVGVWALAAVAGVVALGVAPDFFDMLLHDVGTALVFSGLGLTGLGGLVAVLAAGVPGRETAVKVGFTAAALGMAAAAGTGTLLLLQSPLLEPPVSATHHLACLARAAMVAVVPALSIMWFAGRAAPHRPLVLVLAAGASMAALGAVTAQASCYLDDVRHLMIGHIAAPVLLAVVLSLPLLVALRRFRS